MIEAFTDGLDNLNEARDVLGLKFTPQSFYYYNITVNEY